MKGAKAAPKSVKSSKGTITKGKRKSTGGAASGAVKEATKKMKQVLCKEIRAEYNSGCDDFMHELLVKQGAEDAEFDFEQEELEELLWAFVKNGCCDDEVVKFLLEQGLELDHRQLYDDETPLGWARINGDKDVVEAVRKAITWFINFDYAIRDNSVSSVNRVIEKSTDVNVVGSDCFATPLHYAAFKAVALDDLTCLKLLLEAGAKERLVIDPEVSKEALTPTQFIQKRFGGEGDKVGAVERAVDLLYEYSSAGKRAAKLEAKIDLLAHQVQLLVERA